KLEFTLVRFSRLQHPAHGNRGLVEDSCAKSIQQPKQVRLLRFELVHARRPEHGRIDVGERAVEVGDGVTIRRLGQNLGAEAMFSQDSADDIERLKTMTR